MPAMKRGGAGSCYCFFLVSVFFLFLNHHSHCNATSQDDYAMLLENQGITNDATDTKSKLVSSLKSLLEQEEQSKRASSFFPLRGKKTLLSESNNPDNYQLVSSEEDKRSQFFPLRGKKIPSELKRASYFMPMRGRKDDDWELPPNQEEEEESTDKRASSFMPMRGKKKMGGTLNAFQHFGKSGMYSTTSNELNLPYSSGSDSVKVSDKRMSFIPSRGKKSDSQNLTTDKKSSDVIVDNENETHPRNLRNKRSSAFVPMRGRRLPSDTLEEFQSYENGPPDDIYSDAIKKKHQLFTSMRDRISLYNGKTYPESPYSSSNLKLKSSLSESNKFPDFKGSSNEIIDEILPNEVSTRNKKASSFMPMRGKKQNYQNDVFPDSSEETHNSIMSMHLHDDYFDYNSLADETGDSDQTETSSPKEIRKLLSKESKRASLFMPMRGRRLEDFLKLSPMNKAENNDVLKPVGGYSYEKKAYSFLPMRGRRYSFTNISSENDIDDKRGYSFMPMRGRRWGESFGPQASHFNSYPYFIPTGIGSALISRPFGNRDKYINHAKEAAAKLRRVYDWDSVKRAFHATRGKRLEASNHPDSQDEDSGTSEIEISLQNHNLFKRNIFHTNFDFQPNKNYLGIAFLYRK